MKLPVIKKLVQHDASALAAAEEALINEMPLPFEVPGDDEGEQLTHVIAAIWVKEYMDTHGADYKTAIRQYTQKVRNSIN